MICVTFLFNLCTLLVEHCYCFLRSNINVTRGSVLLGVKVNTANSTYVTVLCERFNVLEIVLQVLTNVSHISRTYESEDGNTFKVLKVHYGLCVNESRKIESRSYNHLCCFLVFTVNVTIHSIEHISTHVANTNRYKHRIGHFLFIEILELVLCECDLVLNVSVRNFDSLAVTLTHLELFSTISSLVSVDSTLHTSSTHKRVINSYELL